MSEQWYALHIRPRFEKHVQMHLEHKGYDAFLPTYVSKRRWSDRVKSLTLPLFPGYIFCRFDISARLPILVTPGVNFIVGMGRVPVPVDPEEIAAVQQILAAGVPSRPWPYLRDGERVRIESGALEGLTGIVIRHKGGERLIVSVSLLMRSVCVELDRSSVRPIGTSHEADVSDSERLLTASR